MVFEQETVFSIAKLLNLKPASLWTQLSAWRHALQDRKKQRKATDYANASARIVKEGTGALFTTQYYSDDVLSSAGLMRYTVRVGPHTITTSLATRPNWMSLRIPLGAGDENCVVVDATREVATCDPSTIAAMLADIEARGVRVWDAPIFRVLSVDIYESRLAARFCVDRYFRYRFTNGALHDELAGALLDSDFQIDRLLSGADTLLPMRSLFLPANSDLGDLSSRMCASGVNVLTAFARGAPDSDFALIVHRRSSAVGTRQGALSVLPAAHHQPTRDLAREEESRFSRTIIRELYEELFSGVEVTSGHSQPVPIDWYERASPMMTRLCAGPSACEVVMTGAGISLLTGSFNVTAVVLIKDESVWSEVRDVLRPNWEGPDDHAFVYTKGPAVERLLRSPEWMDYSYEALVEGLLFLRDVAPDRVRLPSLMVESPGGQQRQTLT